MNFLNHKGFSLIELMMVISIMSVLTTFAMPKYYKLKIQAARSEATMNMRAMHTMAMAYHAENSVNAATFSYGNNILAGSTLCTTPNALGFRSDNCGNLRYGYRFNRDGSVGNGYDASGRTYFTIEASQLNLKFSNPADAVWDAQTATRPIVGICRADGATGLNEFFFDWWTMFDNGSMQPAWNDPRNNAEVNCLAGFHYDFLP